MVPIIDREIFFGNPEFSGAQISPDGKVISFLKPLDGVRNIWVKPVGAPFESARPVTDDKNRPIMGYFWSRDSAFILYVQDKGGDENFHVYAVDPNEDHKGIPISRDLTPYDGCRAYIMNLPKSDHHVIRVGLNDRQPAWHDLYEVNIRSGKRKLIQENTFEYNAVYFDLKDQLRLASKSLPDGGTEILRKSGEDFQTCLSVTHEESIQILKFIDDDKVYFATNMGDHDLVSLRTLNLTTGEVEIFESDPQESVDFQSAIFSQKDDRLVGTAYVGDQTRYYWKDENYENDHAYLTIELGTGQITITSGTSDDSKWIVYSHSDVDPGAAYLFDRGNRSLNFLYRPRPKLPIEHLCQMKPVRYSSHDGLEIPAYLTIPQTKDQSSVPAILLVHGGPWARDYWGYHSYAQFLANRGYAVLQPNFRGSTGFGKSFLNAGNGEWGDKMQDDITAGVDYLVEKGISKRDNIGIMGGSYGGYACLAGLAFTPEVYACGISIVGPSNLFTLLESIPPYWETVREMFHIRMGNPNTDQGQALLKKKSPYFHAEKIKSPLLVAQGNNDPRVKTAESEQIVCAMQKHALSVEYMNFLDEGHGFANPRNNMAFLAVAERFLARHLNGRFQEDIPEYLQIIIDQVTVDPESLCQRNEEG